MHFSDDSRNIDNNRGMMRSLTTFADARGDESAGRLIPRSDIPVQPVLSWDTIFSRSGERAPAVVEQGLVVHVTAARIAIAHALELVGLVAGQKVLVPAFHCPAMVEPVVHFGAEPVFYALCDDLSVDLNDVSRRIDAETRILVAVNYFGFPQKLAVLRRFCDERGLIFIEDCAHSFFGSYDGRPLGAFGHFAVASLTKFFPVRDGGCLIVGSSQIANSARRLRSQSLGANAAAVFDLIEEAVGYGRLRGFVPIVQLANRAKGVIRGWSPDFARERSENPAVLRSGQKGGFDPAWIGVRGSAISRVVQRYASRNYIVAARRRNYLRLVQEFSGLRRCRPLFTSLPEGVVPYMFPLWVDDLAGVFATLEDRAVPMQRFGQFPWQRQDEPEFDMTSRISRELIQLPCHQNLREEEIGTLVDRVRAVVA